MVEMWDESFGSNDKSIIAHINKADGQHAFDKMHQLLDKTWKEVYRILKPGGFLCINIGDSTRNLGGRFRIYHNHSRINNICHSIGFDTLPSIIWRKPTNAPNKFMGSGMLPAGAYVTLEHEYILIMRKGEKRVFTKDEKENRSRSAIFWEERNSWFSDQWTDVRGSRQKLTIDSLRTRSAAFPIEIPQRLIQMYSAYNDTVLDPFSGTGTTSLAAMTAGRNSISLDNDSKLLSSTLKFPTKRPTKHALNDHILKRLNQHMNYVKEKDMLFFRYRNMPMGIPVKTLQEKLLTLFPIKSIYRKDDIVTVNYRNLKSSEVRESMFGKKSVPDE